LNELKSPAGCLVVAKELADVTGALPGPYAIEAFLDRGIGLAHPDLKTPVAISDAVTACLPEWRTEALLAHGLDDVLDLCPAHVAI
jgi:hypothetical protein